LDMPGPEIPRSRSSRERSTTILARDQRDSVINVLASYIPGEVSFAPFIATESTGENIARSFRALPPTGEHTMLLHIGKPMMQADIDEAWKGMRPAFEANYKV